MGRGDSPVDRPLARQGGPEAAAHPTGRGLQRDYAEIVG